ncbi:MAG: FAD-dependent oxidoreductase [Candidatus Lindowbacteria bacterium]|nr:FAD-dependent oxidoreductase [Candidatus Lindowbacteria bacterium]
MENKRVIIVGAGLGGLSAGYWLLQRGFEVEILEASDRPGGRTILMERKGDRVDVGAQFYHSNFRNAIEFMNVTNLSSTKRPVKGNIRYALEDGSFYVYDRRNPYMKLVGLRGNLRMYQLVLKHILFGHRLPSYVIKEDIPEYDNMEVFEAFASRHDGPLRDYFVTLLSMGATSGRPEWMSFYCFIRHFQNILFPGYISLTGGIASLAYELAKRLPVRYGTPVRKLVTEKGSVVGVQLDNDGSVRKAGHVIVATTPPAAAPLMPEEMAEQRRFLESVTYAQSPMPVFFLDRPLDKNIWCYFSDPKIRKTYGYAVDQLMKAPETVPSGKSILVGFGIYPMSSDLMDKPDDVVLKKAQEDIELMVPGFSRWIEDARVQRHKFVNAIYPPGAHKSVLDFLETARKLRRVSFVSSVLCGEAMEAAMMSAAAAVKRVCGWGGV